ncbi:hypothetical protein CSPAE12_07603 [Colletotrichum incanum]|nr:hypothetical protein CSPAE12_07603 [Colletotrichum incanum]
MTASSIDDQALSPVTTGTINTQTMLGTLDSISPTTTYPVSEYFPTLIYPPHVVLTTLPSGANFQILEGVTYTSPTYITTTSPGSDQPTIVPIIAPFSGPPKICFGCFAHFPPNIKIDVPEFCIQLFGLKIGNCPPKKNKNKDDKKGDGDGDDGNADDDNKPTSQTRKPRTSRKQTTTTSVSSSSCTVIITATQKSVFCSVTPGNSADAVCSTSTYTTATECSVPGSATTVTTTHTPTPTIPLCAPGECGGRFCSVKTKRSKFSIVQDLGKRGDPAIGKWPDPSDHQTHQGFIVNQLDGMFGGTATKPRYNPKLVKHHPEGSISADWVTFKDNVEAVALEGLYGCTSIILVSRRGAWISHIWQTVFENLVPNIDEFEMMIDEDLPYRIPPDEPFHEYYEYGLEDMKDNPELGDAGVMFGNDAVAVDTPLSLNMRAFIVTPRKWQTPGLFTDTNGQFIPHEILNHINHQQGTVRYPNEIERLKRAVAGVYGDIPLEVVDYNPIVPKWAHLEKWSSERKMVDDYGNVFEIEDYMAVQTNGNVRGKVLLQYQPATTCGDMAEWRLWVEGQPVGSRTDKWAPLENQMFSSPGNIQALARRQGQVCELPVRSEVHASGFPTSAGGSASSPVSQAHSSGSSAQASSKPPLSSKHSLSSPQTIASVAATLSSTSSSERFKPSGSDLFLSAIRVSTTPRWVSTTTTGTAASSVSSATTATPFTNRTSSSSKEVIKTTSFFSKPSAAKPSGPLPSEAVAIYYVETIAPDEDGKLEYEGAWWMFPVKTDDANFDPCGKEPQGWKFLDKHVSLDSVPWPPAIEAEKFFFDRRYCKYKGENGPKGWGKLSCEDIPEFSCERDPRAARKLECGKDPEVERTFLPRILCRFPVSGGTSLRDKLEEVVGGPGKVNY